MNVAFDYIAQHYDQEFTDTPIGKLQREQVWKYLQSFFSKNKIQHTLELNCGTGADALLLAENCQQVYATDISAEMVEITQQKAIKAEKQQQIHTQAMNVLDITASTFDEQFDLVFSNFGGLNCISPNHLVAWCNEVLPDLLNPKGHFIAVIMPKYCLWEMGYFLAKLKFKKAFRRQTNGYVEASLASGVTVQTWYHDTRGLAKGLQSNFIHIHQQPVGFTLPPSYLHGYFQKHPKRLQKLANWENTYSKYSFLANYADHYLIHFQKK